MSEGIWHLKGFPGGSVVKNPPAIQETQVLSLGWEDSLEEAMATCSSILAWGIPWIEEPGGVQSLEVQSRTRLSDLHTRRGTKIPHVSGKLLMRISSVQFSSVTQSCPILCDPMNCSTPGLPVHHQLLEFTQTHVHRVVDAIQPFLPLLSPFPPAPNHSQLQSLFQ